MLLPLLLTGYTTLPPPEAPTYNGREGQLRVAVPRLEDGVVVDGVLEEPAWAWAARLTGFSQYAPVDGRPAANATEVLIWYSPGAIHFGVRAAAAPGSVRDAGGPRRM